MPTSDFLDACFSRTDRMLAAIGAARVAGRKTAFLISDAQRDEVLEQWTRPWGPAGDRFFVDKLLRYITNQRLAMFVPRLTEVGPPPPALAVYQLDGYARYDFADVDGPTRRRSVLTLLKLFAAGAHFVAIHSDDDRGDAVVKNFYNLMYPHTKFAPGHSHYGKAGNIVLPKLVKSQGLYYPRTPIEETAPADIDAYIVSLLIGPTSKIKFNSFFQLEGWPGTSGAILTGVELARYMTEGRTLSRHMADYVAHQNTVWNISTYGACPYSEKRGASIFLAPVGWNATPDAETLMARYRGGEEQTDPQLLQVPQPAIGTPPIAAPADFDPT